MKQFIILLSAIVLTAAPLNAAPTLSQFGNLEDTKRKSYHPLYGTNEYEIYNPEDYFPSLREGKRDVDAESMKYEESEEEFLSEESENAEPMKSEENEEDFISEESEKEYIEIPNNTDFGERDSHEKENSLEKRITFAIIRFFNKYLTKTFSKILFLASLTSIVF